MPQDLARRLIQTGLVSEQRLREAQETARAERRSLADVLVESGAVAEADLLPEVARLHGLEFVRLASLAVEDGAVKAVPAKLASHYRVMPVRLEAGTLTVALADPLDASAVEDIETNLGYRVERVLACRADIDEALRRHYGVGADTVERILADTPERQTELLPEETQDLERMAEDASVVKLVNQIIHQAISDRATDIHFEVARGGVAVRRRIDGVLYDISVPRNIRYLYPAIVSRVKMMSSLDIVERRLPQDGRARVSMRGANYDLRVSIVPSVHGEDVVLRILPAAMLFDLGDLGLNARHLGMLEELIARPHGIIVVTGPTGSGKSTTLYACLTRLNTRDRKIITIEDPVEYELEGITQTQVNPAIGLTFARALRSMLRHDPDVMMVGEVRDAETAEIAVQTAMTGHLVLTTLHTNDAAGGAVRLTDMGIEPYLITSTVMAFTAQRLVRVICRRCREEYAQDGRTRYRGAGCRHCNGSGFRGRVAICEFLPLTPEIQTLILARSSAKTVREKADALGMPTLAQDGWEKVEQGMTTAEEVMRVTTL
ncbi:MAG: type II/IV secretion system protein [Lentisphaerae bacterium]|nr:type II/IV secretion system protein [Lentisphaerota bacterium]